MRSPALKQGLLYGLTLVVMYLTMYYANPRLLFNLPLSVVISYGVPILFMYLAIREKREQQDGFISLGEGVKETFITYLIGSLIGILFTHVLFEYIDPSLYDLSKEVTAEMAESFGKMFGADEAEINEMSREIGESDFQFGLGALIISWLVSLVFPGIIIALILAAIFRRDG